MSFVNLESVTLADGAQLDGFGRLKVSIPNTSFDSQQEYGLDTLRVWDCTANGTLPTVRAVDGFVSDGAGNSVGPRNTNTRLTPITVTATNGHYSVLQSRQFPRYIPGKSQLVYITGVFAAGADAAVSICLRTSTSGGVVDTEIAQANWSEDGFGIGTKNPSGITIDFTDIQILVIDAQMLYAGRVRIGFDVDGCLHWAHYFKIANNQITPTMQTYNLPVRFEGRTDADSTFFRVGYFGMNNGVFLKTDRTTKGGTTQFECCSVQSESGGEMRGFPRSVGTSPTARVAVTTRRSVLAIRPKATFMGITNRSHIELSNFVLTATTNNLFYEIVAGGTITGAVWTQVGNTITAGAFVVGKRYVILTVGTTNFTLIGAASNTIGVEFVATGAGAGTGTANEAGCCADFDVTGTTVTGGLVLKQGRVPTGTGIVAAEVFGEVDLRNPLTISQIDNLAVTQYSLALVCTAETGTANVTADLNWNEQTN